MSPNIDSYILVGCEQRDVARIRQALFRLHEEQAVSASNLVFTLGRGVPPYTTSAAFGNDWRALRDILGRNLSAAKSYVDQGIVGRRITCSACSRQAITCRPGMIGLTNFIVRLGWKRRGTRVVCQRCATSTDEILSVFDPKGIPAIRRSGVAPVFRKKP